MEIKSLWTFCLGENYTPFYSCQVKEVWGTDNVCDEHLSYDFGPDVLSPMMPLFN